MTIRVTAQWALWGKEELDLGYHLLGWSEGTISPENFTQLLTRYSPGTLESLPQVTISWLPASSGRVRFMGIAIHDTDRRYAAARLPARSRAGPASSYVPDRDAELTSYFCLPFTHLAAGAVSYRAMFAGLRAIRLPAGPGKPISVDLDAGGPPAPGAPAMRAAALLLTGKPVCILGAGQANLTERLGFLDSVASLLPYGLRSKLSASTWTSSTFQGHRLRLFFARAPRRGDDHTVRWGASEHGPIGDTQADAYLRWLCDDPPRRVRQLAAMRQPLSFSWLDDLLEASGAPPTWWV